jgi:hypothetical protein
MQVGLNYPWRDYGWDFGFGPPTWRGSRMAPRWYDDIDQHLDRFHELGITVVRWFILADGLTYGTAGDAPRADMETGGWRFDPPSLSAAILDHFDELLRRFASVRDAHSSMQLLPVLIDFLFCEPGTTPVAKPDPTNPLTTVPDTDWVKQGRADVITDANKRRTFLDEVLDPLLRLSQRNHGVIYAWELINEPDWITIGWHSGHQTNATIDDASMRAFLDEGSERIRRAGFKPTIGFASLKTLRRSNITVEINQFHHYPAGRRVLERHTFDSRFPGIIGEFATATTDRWPELASTGQSVLNRLRLADAHGYPLAIPWSFLARDRHTSWSSAVEREVASFIQGQHDPPGTIA